MNFDIALVVILILFRNCRGRTYSQAPKRHQTVPTISVHTADQSHLASVSRKTKNNHIMALIIPIRHVDKEYHGTENCRGRTYSQQAHGGPPVSGQLLPLLTSSKTLSFPPFSCPQTVPAISIPYCSPFPLDGSCH